MNYEMIVLDLDGTLTNSQKIITEPTKAALRKVQKLGKHIVLASGRPTAGMTALAEELEFQKYGGYILSFNGACIINGRTNEVQYNKTVNPEYIRTIYEMAGAAGTNIVTYSDDAIISAYEPNEYTMKESFITKMPVKHVDDFLSYIDFPINKLLLSDHPDLIIECEKTFKQKFHSALNIFRSEPYFLEIMPQQIDKAHSIQKLVSSLGLTRNEIICCGDGYNDLTMIEGAGLGVAMANAQKEVLEAADYITKSNDEDGIVEVIEKFML